MQQQSPVAPVNAPSPAPAEASTSGPGVETPTEWVGNRRLTEMLKRLPGSGSGIPAPVLAPLYGLAPTPDANCDVRPVLALVYGPPTINPPERATQTPGQAPSQAPTSPAPSQTPSQTPRQAPSPQSGTAPDCRERAVIAPLYGVSFPTMSPEAMARPQVNAVYGVPMPGASANECLPAPTVALLYGVAPMDRNRNRD